ncbi:MAG: hypothetical protein PSU93_14275 [Methylobacter sp.]|uniref:Uncharacterized protein n=1 Tax=Candidatus Methylobacter titanis TaxID=3053457 RepID=A0AA43Q872_9GAMM|nr:hypothetical protein [Candidatus Methylobacter titanis]
MDELSDKYITALSIKGATPPYPILIAFDPLFYILKMNIGLIGNALAVVVIRLAA